MNRINKGLLYGIATVLTGVAPGYARQLSVEEAAANVPAGYLPVATRGASQDLLFTQKDGNRNVAYVLDGTYGGGYLVVAADDVLPALLGYADSGEFDAANIPPAMKAWLEGYGRQLSYAVEHGLTRAEGDNTTRTAIAPLCASKWNQLEPYNWRCPTVSGVATPTGCTATAIAQMAYKHKWPLKGTGSNTYKSVSGTSSQQLTFDFANTEFDWANMLDDYSGYYTMGQGNAVAQLMLACGNAALMQYGTSASGAYTYDALYGLVKFMGYDKGAVNAVRDYYSLSEWNDLIYTDLAKGNPVVYGGYNYEGGHTFIVDGYRDGYFHLNWGWGGLSDGYFLLTALDPSEQGVGGSSAGYNFYQDAMIGLEPQKEGSDYRLEVYQYGSLAPKVASFPRAGSLTLIAKDGTYNGYFTSFTLADKTVKMGVKLTPEAGGEAVFYPGAEVTYTPHYGNPEGQSVESYTVPAADMPEDGVYYATPAYEEDGVVKDVRVKVGYSGKIKLTFINGFVKAESVSVERTLTATDITLTSPLYSGKTCSLTALLSNDGAEYYGQVYPALVDANGNRMATMNGVNVNLTDGDSQTVTCTGVFLTGSGSGVAAGDYFINIFDDNGNALSTDPLAVTVSSVPSGKAEVTLTYSVDGNSGSGTYSDPYIVGNSMKFDLTVNVTSGVFDDYVCVYSQYADDNSYTAATAPWNAYFAAKDYPCTKSFTLDTSGFEAGRVAYLRAYGYTSAWADSSGWIGGYVYVKRSTSGVSEVAAANTGVYPNPVDDVATVTATDAIRMIDVYSISGVKVASQACAGDSASEQISLGSLTSGHYIAVVTTSAGIERFRLIKR